MLGFTDEFHRLGSEIIGEQLMDNDKQLKFITNMVEVNLEPEQFIEQIRLFSQYLVYSNKDYKYNETYLENFCLEFINFKKYVGIKNQIFQEVIKCIKSYSWNLDLQLSVDQFWVYPFVNREVPVNTNINANIVCSENILIKGMLVHENTMHLFLKEYKIIEHEKILAKVDVQICNELLQWVEDLYNGKEEK